MKLQIPYGNASLTATLPDERIAAVMEANHNRAAALSPREIVLHALENPIDSPRLRDLAKGKRRVCVITSDHTRPVPSALTLPLLLEEIRSGNPEADIRILIATGMHRATTKEEMIARFGREVFERENFIVHDSRRDEEMVSLGKLPSGGELLINKEAVEADLLVAEGFIEPHFFAGFSGGRKSVLPGIASYRTVMYNHNAQFIANPKSTQGVLEENPIHQDMIFAAHAAKLAFILNVILDEHKAVYEAYAGNVDTAHEAGCRSSLNSCRVTPVVGDIAITSNGGAPLDQNIYQAVKGMTAAENCVRPGGVIIMCAACRDGHGGQAFFEWFSQRESAAAVMNDILKVAAEDTTPDQWQAQILARVMLKATCIFVTEAANKDYIEGMHMTWAPDLNTALALADTIVGKDAKVTVIPNGVDVICN